MLSDIIEKISFIYLFAWLLVTVQVLLLMSFGCSVVYFYYHMYIKLRMLSWLIDENGGDVSESWETF